MNPAAAKSLFIEALAQFGEVFVEGLVLARQGAQRGLGGLEGFDGVAGA